MSLHHLNPSDAPRDCPGCIHCGGPIIVKADDGCDGSGRLPGAKPPDVEVYVHGFKPINPFKPRHMWFWSRVGTNENGVRFQYLPGGHNGPFPTQAAALAAARAAAGVKDR